MEAVIGVGGGGRLVEAIGGGVGVVVGGGQLLHVEEQSYIIFKEYVLYSLPKLILSEGHFVEMSGGIDIVNVHLIHDDAAKQHLQVLGNGNVAASLRAAILFAASQDVIKDPQRRCRSLFVNVHPEVVHQHIQQILAR